MSDHVTTRLGDTVAFDRYPGDGLPVVFVAGAGPWRAIDAETTATAELLAARGVPSLVPDRLGRGESFVPGPVSLDREMAAVAALVDAAGGRAVLCGHSSGCAISLYAAAVEKQPVASLALWEAPLAPPDSGGREWADEIDRQLDAGDLEAAFRHFMQDMPPEILEYVMSNRQMVEQAGSLRPDAAALAWAESAPHAELLGHLDVPTLALIGAESYDVMQPAAESIAAAVPGASWKRIAGAQHAWDPAAMADELVAFVAKCR